MLGIKTWAALSLSLLAPAPQVEARQIDDLYVAKAIVTGQGERNRQPGFRDCLERVLIRVSGDQRLPKNPAYERLRASAGDYVSSFSYRDRLAGKAIHDEQGTYDRPHDLTCRYDLAVINNVLAKLGSRPWLEKRPTLAVFLDVQPKGSPYRVSPVDPRDLAMRESFALGAEPMAMQVRFPAQGDIDAWALGPAAPELLERAEAVGADLPLVGRLMWSDADLGWVATWRLSAGGMEQRWTVRGVNFDEAFRVAVRGVAQIRSGNGSP